MTIGILGFGEAGAVFGQSLSDAGADVLAYDILLDDPQTVEDCRNRISSHGCTYTSTPEELALKCDIVLSTVTANNALAAAQSLGAFFSQDFVDLNSVSPETKKAIAQQLTANGATVTAGVAMDTVPEKGSSVPLLFSGPSAERVSQTLAGFGLNTKHVGSDVERCAQIKLVRSIFIKGFEAVFAEAMEIATTLNVWDEVCTSLEATFPNMNWAELVPYHIGRIEMHGKRRAAEMQECARMIEEAGLDAELTRAIAKKHEIVSARNQS